MAEEALWSARTGISIYLSSADSFGKVQCSSKMIKNSASKITNQYMKQNVQNVKWGTFPVYYSGYEITKSNNKFPWFVWQECCKIWTEISRLCEEMYLWVCWNLIWDQCTELDPEHSEISRNGNNPVTLTELWTKFLWSIFSLLCKVKMTPVPGHASNPVKNCRFNLTEQFWEHKSIHLCLSHPCNVGTTLSTLQSTSGSTIADDNPRALHIIEIKLVNNAWVFWVFICMLDGYLNLAVRYDNLSYSSSQKAMSILFFIIKPEIWTHIGVNTVVERTYREVTL